MIKTFESHSNGKSVILYHGYWSSIDDPDYIAEPDTDRIEVLEDMGIKAVSDIIDYDQEWYTDRCRTLFLREAEKAKKFDVIMGFSLGGYMAYKLAGYVSKDLILVNPAIDRSITLLDIKEFDCPNGKNFKRVEVFLGERDMLIDKRITINYLKKEGVKCDAYLVPRMEHRTPLHFFRGIVRASKILNDDNS
jgi:hypothetical protein